MRMMRILLFAGYWAFLTVLLLAPYPAKIVGMTDVPQFPFGHIGIHFCAFSMLTLLAHSARWPARPGWLVIVLVIYGGATEIIQHFVPPRTMGFKDFVADACGVLVGTCVYWVIWRCFRPQSQRADLPRELIRQMIATSKVES